MKLAQDIVVGDEIIHSGFFWEVIKVSIRGDFVICRVSNGGEISFLVGDVVQNKVL